MGSSLLADLNAASWSLEDHAVLIDGVWIPHSSSTTNVSYPEEFRDRLANLEETSLWFQSRNVLIRALLERHSQVTSILDVGAGNGSVALYLQTHGVDAVAIEPALVGASRCAARGVQVVIAGQLEDVALPSGCVEAIGLFDVVEHLEDPRLLISEVHRVLKTDGFCFLTAPAYQWLWSQADEHAGHYRRYTRKSLHSLMTDCGFEHHYASYCFSGALPLLVARRTVPFRIGRRLSNDQLEESFEQDLSGNGKLSRWLGEAATRVEARWMRVASVPFGTSIIAAYRKN